MIKLVNFLVFLKFEAKIENRKMLNFNFLLFVNVLTAQKEAITVLKFIVFYHFVV